MPSDPNTDVLREVYGRVIYTHKAHEKDREFKSRSAFQMKLANIALTALTFGGLVGTATLDNTKLLWASLILATLTLGFTVFQLSFDPAKDAARHRIAAKSLLAIRERYVNLLADIANGLPVDDVQIQRDELQAELNEIYQQAPDTSSRAFSAAKKALKLKGEMTFSTEELDHFLPASLKSTPVTDSPT
ncbi:SLATT domain-containing protein [Rhodococcus qingshengii]|uniref:SLATT domain-containing protein n=1 Tax=Rhodococcus qingshengii TaxID=334542 RepID=UPI001C8BC44D|nr:SLATT domain-containing protein [Rhodococcus qingshengii]MBX9147972.1 SLATT domain-containing protein [Rhodococcus qingshengii]